MTVLDASNNLYEWYQSHDSFEMNKDIRKVVPIMEDEEETTCAFKLALASLEEQGMLASMDHGDKRFYILSKPYDAYNQQVDLNSWTTRWMSGEINEFCEIIGDNTDLCVAANVSDKDVRNMIHIIQFYKSKVAEKELIIGDLNNSENDDDEGNNNDGKKKKK